MSSCKSRTIVTDANGNPNIIGILSESSGAATGIVTATNGSPSNAAFTISVSFTTAQTAFNAS